MQSRLDIRETLPRATGGVNALRCFIREPIEQRKLVRESFDRDYIERLKNGDAEMSGISPTISAHCFNQTADAVLPRKP